MVKKIAFLLSLCILLQLSWTVVSAYCQHESGRSAQHFGHHAHQHQDANTDADADSKLSQSTPANSAAHADCAACPHGSWLSHVPDPQYLAGLMMQMKIAAPPAQTAQIDSEQPDRPNWIALA